MQNHDDLYAHLEKSPEEEDGLSSLLDESERGVSSEEKESILSQIDRVLSHGAAIEAPEDFIYTPKHNGALFPLFINILILAITAGAVWGIYTLFNRQEASLITRGDVGITAEGSLLKEFREESEKELAAREEEILGIRSELSTLEQEKISLAAEKNRILREKEQELDQRLKILLEEERLRLRDSGTNAEETERLVAALEQKMLTEHRDELEALKADAEAARIKREEDIDRLLENYEQQLEEYQSGEEGISRELKALQERREQANILIQQISAGYIKIIDNINKEQFDEARESVRTIEGVLSQDLFKDMPELVQRSQADMAFISILSRYIALKERDINNPQSISEIGGLDNNEKAMLNARIEEQNNELEMKKEEIAVLSSSLSASRDELNGVKRSLVQTGKELNTYGRELSVLKDRKRLADQRVQKMEELVEAIQNTIESGNGEDRRQKILTAVDTKLELREFLSSKEINSLYPEAEAIFEGYLDTFEAEYIRQGYKEALMDLDSLFENLLKGEGIDPVQSFKRSGGDIGEASVQVLSKISDLLNR